MYSGLNLECLKRGNSNNVLIPQRTAAQELQPFLASQQATSIVEFIDPPISNITIEQAPRLAQLKRPLDSNLFWFESLTPFLFKGWSWWVVTTFIFMLMMLWCDC
jgi:hypothetical protein